MSELFDEEPKDPAPPQRNGRARALVITGAVVVAGLFLLSTFATLYTDRLWYNSLGFGHVFSTMLWTRVGLFLLFGVLMAVAVGVNLYLAYRFRPLFGLGGGDASIDRYRDAVTPIRTWLLIGTAGVLGIFAGSSAVGQWRSYLMWRNGESFGNTDAYFDKDVGFYVFDLPWWHFLVDFAMTTTIVALVATAVVHYLYGGIRLQVTHDRLSGAAQVQLSVLLGLFVLFKAVDYYLDRFDLVLNDNSLFTGMNFTGDNALLPARNILIGVAAICAVLFFLNVWRRTWQLPSVGLALFVLSAILLGMIWPALVQQFQVNPTEADKESDYIAANIEATRQAYDIDDIEMQSYQGIPESADSGAAALNTQLAQVPLVDPQQVFETFEQRQQPRVYYSVPPVLDVDRYTFNGTEVPLVLGVREVDPEEVPEPNWTNMHTVYTHGEGVIAAYANRVSPDEGNGRMVWAEGIEDAENVFSKIEDYEPRIYYGEMSPAYSVVGKSDGGEDVELGLGLEEVTDSDDAEEAVETDRQTTYDGAGGVAVGNVFKELLYGIRFGEPNFLLSGRVHDNSKVLYNRRPIERVEAVAPWLTVDRDPYPAVIDGKVKWILDGYTTTDRYPNSQRESLESMTDDSLQQNTGFATIPTDEINYIRSAVKVTVDAYDGTVEMYEWDESDPILQTWMNVFPESVQPKSEISDALMSHLRYPEDLFKAQRYQLAKYHVTDPAAFYGGTELWEVPEDPEANGNLQPPYRLFTRDLLGQNSGNGTNWNLTSAFVPDDRSILAAYVQVDSDATSPTFGEMRVLEMSDNNVPGPGIAANEMQQDQGVRDQLRDFLVSGATPPVFGNLLTLPVSDGLIYIQPVYAERAASASSFPILQYVMVRYGSDVGIGRNLADALRDAVSGGSSGGQQQEPDDSGGDGDTGDGDQGGDQGGQQSGGDAGGGTLDQRIDRALELADEAFQAADQARADGDLAERERQLEIAQRQFDRAIELLGQQEDAGQGGGQEQPSGE